MQTYPTGGAQCPKFCFIYISNLTESLKDGTTGVGKKARRA